MAAELNLVVLRSADVPKAVAFYPSFGIEFTAERHGSGPEHFAADPGGTVFELYPRGDGASSEGVRLGFRVTALASVLAAAEAAGGRVVSPAKESPWGLRAVAADPDGHRVELVEASPASPGRASAD